MPSPPNDLPAPRRIVTSHSDDGVAKVWINEQIERINPSTKFDTLYAIPWTEPNHPAKVDTEIDGAKVDLPGIFHANGSVCRYVDFEPGHVSPMHRTLSIDYGIVLFGEIELLLDDGSSTLAKQGDIVVQRATNHAWRNNTDKWARVIFILIAAEKPVIGGKELEEIAIVA